MAKILLAEDDSSMRTFLARALERVGHDVISVADGFEALPHIANSKFDLLLTDIVMPSMGGRELASRAVAVRPGLKVLFISAYAHTETEPSEYQAAGFGYVPKPFTKEALCEAVARLLANGSEANARTANAAAG